MHGIGTCIGCGDVKQCRCMGGHNNKYEYTCVGCTNKKESKMKLSEQLLETIGSIDEMQAKGTATLQEVISSDPMKGYGKASHESGIVLVSPDVIKKLKLKKGSIMQNLKLKDVTDNTKMIVDAS